LHSGHDIYPLRFTSHRRVLGHFVVMAKKMLQQLLTPILERQLAYNVANTRVTSSLWEQVESLRQQQATALQALRADVVAQVAAVQQQATALQALRAEVGAQMAAVQQQAAQMAAVQQQQAALQAEVAAWGQSQGDALQALGAQVAAVQQQQATVFQALRTAAEQEATEWATRFRESERTVAQLKTESVLQERRITLLLEESRKRLPDAWDQAQLQSVAAEADHVLDALYVSFEDQFRGTRADIK